jgi:hypothetical protein
MTAQNPAAFDTFIHNLCLQRLNLNTDALKLALTNIAPVRTMAVYSDLLGEVANGNGYTRGGAVVPLTSSTNVAGVETVSGSPVIFTSFAGPVGPFRYPVLYDSVSLELMMWWDIGFSQSLDGTLGDSFAFNPDGDVLLSIAVGSGGGGSGNDALLHELTMGLPLP